MATRYTAYSENLWRAAAAVFNSIINSGLPAVNKTYFNPEDLSPPTTSWSALAEVLEWFLLGSYTVAIDTATVDAVLEEPSTAQAATAEATTGDAATSTSVSHATPASIEALSDTAAAQQTPTASNQEPAPDTSTAASGNAASTSQHQEADTALGEAQGGSPKSSQPAVASSSRPPTSHSQRNSQSQGPSKAPSRDPSFKEAAVSDTEQSSSDAELETSVVDTLTDAVLTACSHAPDEVQQRLIAVLDQAIVRPKSYHIPNSAAGMLLSL